MPVALMRLFSEPVSSNDSMHTQRSLRSRLSVAARLMGATSSLDATHTSSTRWSVRRNLRASSAEEKMRSQSCAARFSPASPMNSGCCKLVVSAHSATKDPLIALPRFPAT